MLDRVLNQQNLEKAIKHVIANKGGAGVDGLKVKDLAISFASKRKQIIAEIKDGTYQAQPILGVEIPKGGGKTRLLGIPTTTERVLQQAVNQSIAILFEVEFSPNS
jgi:retron-type reverse transcriptase